MTRDKLSLSKLNTNRTSRHGQVSTVGSPIPVPHSQVPHQQHPELRPLCHSSATTSLEQGSSLAGHRRQAGLPTCWTAPQLCPPARPFAHQSLTGHRRQAGLPPRPAGRAAVHQQPPAAQHTKATIMNTTAHLPPHPSLTLACQDIPLCVPTCPPTPALRNTPKMCPLLQSLAKHTQRALAHRSCVAMCSKSGRCAGSCAQHCCMSPR